MLIGTLSFPARTFIMAFFSKGLTDAQLEKLILESDSEDDSRKVDDVFDVDDSDEDPDFVITQEDSESEQSGNEEIEDPPTKQKRLSILKGKSGYRPEKRGRIKSRNLVTHLPGPKGAAKNISTPLEAWSLLFNAKILDLIVIHTNEEISRRQRQLRCVQSYNGITNLLEIKALIGLLYLSGVQIAAHLNLEELWSLRFGSSLFRATMPHNRFEFLISCLRFDDKETRAERRNTDKFAPIRQIWEMFVENCRSLYTPSEYCTIDEQLMGYRGKCPFRIYMSSKPDKYGIKFLMLNDAKTWYMVNAIPYVGKVTTEDREPVPSYYVRKLSEPIHNTGRNITVDNWFSSVELFNSMLEKYKITMLGTLRKNKVEIPPSFLVGKEVGASKYAFDHNKALVSFTPKKNKVVLVLSTMHSSIDTNSETGKPEMIMDYNKTKGGTDTFDKLCHSYTTARGTRRWPMRVFYGMLDHSGINSMVLFTHSNIDKQMSRRMFINNLAYDLIEPFLKTRLEVTTLRRGLREVIKEIVQIEEPPVLPHILDKKVRCFSCPREKDRKTKMSCQKCHKSMCNEHRAFICRDCEALIY